jgi:uncharacterized protein (DUF1778 family)
MPMTRTTISFTRGGMKLIQKAAKRQGSSVSQFAREAALMRATMATDDSRHLMRALTEQLFRRRPRRRPQSAGNVTGHHEVGLLSP